MLRFVFFLILMSIPMAQAAKREPKKLFLSIGIDEYSDPYWRDLRFAAKDATDIYRYFQTRFDGGWLLTSRNDPDRKVSKGEVLEALQRLKKENTSELDVIIVYISSHGTVGRAIDKNSGSRKIRKFLVTADTQAKNLEDSGLEHQTIFNMFSKLKSRRKVLILDSCYSGGGKSRLTQNILEQLAAQKSDFFQEPRDEIREGTIFLSASAWGEEAVEDNAFKNGVYTHFLIEGFNHDFNQDGAVSITEAHQYAAEKVIAHTKGSQHPTAKIEVVGSDPIIVNGTVKSKGQPLLYAYEWFMRKFSIEVDGESLGTLSKGGVLVKEGKSRLVVKDESNNVLIDKYVDFKKGQEYPLSAYLYYEPKFFVTIGPKISRVLDSDLTDSVFSTQLQGYQIGVQGRQLLGEFSIQAQFGYYPEQDSMITSGNIQVSQTVSMVSLGLSVLGEEPLKSLSTNDTDSYLIYGAGIHRWQFSRNIKDSAFFEQDQNVDLGALGGRLAFRSQFKQIQSNLDVTVDGLMFANNTEIGSDYFPSLEFSVNWGWHW